MATRRRMTATALILLQLAAVATAFPGLRGSHSRTVQEASSSIAHSHSHSTHSSSSSSDSSSGIASSSGSSHSTFRFDNPKPSCEEVGGASKLVFKSYHPSAWEQLWRENAEAWSNSVCEHMIEQQELSWEWLNGTAKFLTPGQPDYGELKQINTTVFSKFVYTDSCDHSRHEEVYIEPLVGLMRHPFTPKNICNPPDVKPVRTQAREYLLFNAMEPETFKALYPGRAYLLDLGTNYYNTSLSWVLRKWSSFGVQFDSVYAWEAEPLDQDLYWGMVPKNVYPYLHMFNVPISNNFAHPGHPFTILKQIYQPGDYVVIKLDIDFATLEASIMREIHADPQLRSMIAEMFFELHFDTPETRIMFQNGEATTPYPDAVKMFHEFREMGLRLHYWP